MKFINFFLYFYYLHFSFLVKIFQFSFFIFLLFIKSNLQKHEASSFDLSESNLDFLDNSKFLEMKIGKQSSEIKPKQKKESISFLIEEQNETKSFEILNNKEYIDDKSPCLKKKKKTKLNFDVSKTLEEECLPKPINHVNKKSSSNKADESIGEILIDRKKKSKKTQLGVCKTDFIKIDGNFIINEKLEHVVFKEKKSKTIADENYLRLL